MTNHPTIAVAGAVLAGSAGMSSNLALAGIGALSLVSFAWATVWHSRSVRRHIDRRHREVLSHIDSTVAGETGD